MTFALLRRPTVVLGRGLADCLRCEVRPRWSRTFSTTAGTASQTVTPSNFSDFADFDSELTPIPTPFFGFDPTRPIHVEKGYPDSCVEHSNRFDTEGVFAQHWVAVDVLKCKNLGDFQMGEFVIPGGVGDVIPGGTDPITYSITVPYLVTLSRNKLQRHRGFGGKQLHSKPGGKPGSKMKRSSYRSFKKTQSQWQDENFEPKPEHKAFLARCVQTEGRLFARLDDVTVDTEGTRSGWVFFSTVPGGEGEEESVSEEFRYGGFGQPLPSSGTNGGSGHRRPLRPLPIQISNGIVFLKLDSVIANAASKLDSDAKSPHDFVRFRKYDQMLACGGILGAIGPGIRGESVEVSKTVVVKRDGTVAAKAEEQTQPATPKSTTYSFIERFLLSSEQFSGSGGAAESAGPDSAATKLQGEVNAEPGATTAVDAQDSAQNSVAQNRISMHTHAEIDLDCDWKRVMEALAETPEGQEGEQWSSTILNPKAIIAHCRSDCRSARFHLLLYPNVFVSQLEESKPSKSSENVVNVLIVKPLENSRARIVRSSFRIHRDNCHATATGDSPDSSERTSPAFEAFLERRLGRITPLLKEYQVADAYCPQKHAATHHWHSQLFEDYRSVLLSDIYSRGFPESD